jgi:hypothetical protein
MAKIFNVPFANSGDKIVIPDPAQGDGSVSYTQGFGLDYERPNTDANYKPVPRQQFNSLINQITDATGEMQKYGAAIWQAVGGPYAIGAVVYYNGKQYQSMSSANNSVPGVDANWQESVVASQVRKILNSNITIYVATTGNDTNNTGLTASSPFQTIQKAWNFLRNNYDLNGNTVTIQIADGNYSSGLNAIGPLVGQKNASDIIFSGNLTTPSNVLFNTGANPCFFSSGALFTVQGVKMQASSNLIWANVFGQILVNNVNFGETATNMAHVLCLNNSLVTITGNYTISGNASYHWYVYDHGTINAFGNISANIVGTPNFMQFAYCTQSANILALNINFTGAATGSKYFASLNGIIDLNLRSANTVLPGNSPGLLQTGAQISVA